MKRKFECDDCGTEENKCEITVIDDESSPDDFTPIICPNIAARNAFVCQWREVPERKQILDLTQLKMEDGICVGIEPNREEPILFGNTTCKKCGKTYNPIENHECRAKK